MSNKKLLIASSNKEEAITNWVLTHQTVHAVIDIIFIADLLTDYDIYDELTDESTIIRCYQANKLKFSNQTHCLLNRITYLPDTLWQAFQPIDRAYSRREVEAYLGFALNSFTTVQTIATNGICEHYYSLPQQWRLVNKTLKIAIPEYYWGSCHLNPYQDEQNIVYSTIYDYLNWHVYRPAQRALVEFCFKKPPGMPLFILSIGTSQLITSDHQLPSEQLATINHLVKKIRLLFNYFICEILFFVTEKQLIFGCLSIDIIRSQKNPLFHNFLQENLLKEYYKCLS